jgi:hypothetical protein
MISFVQCPRHLPQLQDFWCRMLRETEALQPAATAGPETGEAGIVDSAAAEAAVASAASLSNTERFPQEPIRRLMRASRSTRIALGLLPSLFYFHACGAVTATCTWSWCNTNSLQCFSKCNSPFHQVEATKIMSIACSLLASTHPYTHPNLSSRPPRPFKLTTCSFVQDLSFRASLVCADQDAASAHADASAGAFGSGAAYKRKRARTAGAREHLSSSAPAVSGGLSGSDGREKALELKGSHVRSI